MTEGTIVGRIMVVIHTVIREGGPRMTRGMSIEMEVDVVGVIGEFIDFDARAHIDIRSVGFYSELQLSG